MPNPFKRGGRTRRCVDFFAAGPYRLVEMIDAMRFGPTVSVIAVPTWGCSSCNSGSAAPDGEWPIAAPERHGLDSAALAAVIERDDVPIDGMQIVRDGVPGRARAISDDGK